MKTKLSILICLAAFLGACKKNADQPQTNNATIKGTWELRATRYGNIEPATYPQGNGHIVSFGSTTFALYNANALVENGSYKQSSGSQSQYTILAIDNSVTAISQAIINKDTLELIPINPDVASSFYIKTSSNTLAN